MAFQCNSLLKYGMADKSSGAMDILLLVFKPWMCDRLFDRSCIGSKNSFL